MKVSNVAVRDRKSAEAQTFQSSDPVSIDANEDLQARTMTVLKPQAHWVTQTRAQYNELCDRKTRVRIQKKGLNRMISGTYRKGWWNTEDRWLDS